ncbi:transposase [Secundilactobacillus pentosiphilus]|uniref:Transposase n=1 Tax=Secundilactobacillus pentosiphilus TaxID=1714682 RepID=A0A1Z5IPK3_9LACO|nr:RNA-guided endonuclease TnpB family protein [Secundilactobacillus pentosiphilus]GAX03351.1 transposase [Secundilactobacillus pentosiphilus]
MTYQGIKLRLYPNQDQQLKIKLNFGCNRFVWNQMLNMLITRHQNNPEAKFLNTFALNNLLPSLKTEYPWLKDAESTSLQVTNNDLIEAFKQFFQKQHGFPKFKSRKYPKQSYQCKAVNYNVKVVDRHHIQLPKPGNLLKNHQLARAIANQSWRKLRIMLEYKCTWYGKRLVTVNPRKTSQLCSACNYDDGKHTLDIRQWTCPNCGVNHDRDINAATNILKVTA